MVMPSPDAIFSRLNEMFAASSVGITSRFASPFSREFGRRRVAHLLGQRRVALHLALDLEVGIAARGSAASASRIFAADGASLVPKLECDSSATFGVRPKRRISSAASSVISAICSAVGSRFT